MSPKIGRPPIENPKKNRLEIRLDDNTLDDLNQCSEKLKTTRTKVIEMGIQRVKGEIEKKE